MRAKHSSIKRGGKKEHFSPLQCRAYFDKNVSMIKCLTDFSLMISFYFFFFWFVCLSVCPPCSELNRNRIRQVEGLTFQGLSSLEVLKLQRNSISKLTDGAFWDLAKMKALYVIKTETASIHKNNTTFT